MGERVGWITHNGYRILRVDYSGLKGEEFVPVIREVPSAYQGQPKASVRCLIDVRNSITTQESIDEFKKLVPMTREYDKKVAVVGVTGLKKAFLALINVFAKHSMQSFDDDRAALDWLAS